ncbi:GlsB/YeaQ/YmgE family stress response membrane protein [Sphaerisporangium fuscum]|uniref:GlsB/YeaQ/YmgE family stress response membrane protein n=1 Tax=Sphaerisporangium fuscum TaxID=2835868 RepID=UPI001BDDA3B0|nr:GlsB/YeaQ/YmgE family stress response membrane protein [Sphaerisporangium fuscum]
MTIQTILGAIVIGAIVGALGRLILPGRQPIGWILTIVVGIVAALIGTAIAQVLGVATTPGIDWIELVMQVVLAVVGVGLVAGIRGRARV